MGDDLASQINLLNNAKIFENARVIDLGEGVTRAKEVHKGG